MAINTTDQIRSHLLQNSGVNEETMLPLAREYSQDVQQANSRLQACASLLQRGLRSEALQQANIRPNLFDLCAKLDFPEFDEWLEILQFLNIDLPQTLNRDAVQQLQEASVDEQPLEDLLRQHRRLAIGKAPLGWRLRVLRNISKLDSNNPVWMDDVEVWERARLKEMAVQLESASNTKDISVAITIDEELKNPNWQIQPPKDLVKQARSLRERFEYDAQVAELRKLADALNNAFCENNFDRGDQLRTTWNTIIKGMKKPAPLDVLEAVEPAMMWLEEVDRSEAEQDAHLQALNELEKVMSTSRSLPEIERAYHAASHGGFALDDVVEKRYQTLTSELQLSARRRIVLMVAGITAACVVLVAALVLWQIERTRASELKIASDNMRKMLDENRVEDAQAFVTQVTNTKPHLMKNAQFTSLVSELSGKESAEKERAQAFADYLSEADNEDASQIDVSAINRAEKVARTDADKSAIFRLKSRREQWEREAEQRDFQQLRTELDKIKVSVERIEQLAVESLNQEELNGLIKALADMQSKYTRAGSAGRELVDAYHTKLSSLLTTHQSIVSARTKETTSLERIRSAQSLGALKKSLQNYVDSVPNGLQVSDSKRVLAEANLWHLVDRWNDLSQEAEKFSASPTAASAGKLKENIDTLRTRFHGVIWTKIPDTTEKTLDRVPKREESLTLLIDDLRGALLSNLVSVEALLRKGDKPVRLFAYAEHIKRQESAIARMSDELSRSSKFEVVADAEGTVESRTLYPPLSVTQQPKRFTAQLTDYLSENRSKVLNAWDSELLLQMGKTMQNQELDPSHRQLLVGRLMQAGIEGSVFLESRLKNSLKFLDDQLTEPADWFHPHPVTASHELSAEVKQKVLNPLAETYRERENSLADVRALGKTRLTWIGVITKSDGKLVANLRAGNATKGELIVVLLDSEADQLQTKLVGRLENGKANLDQSDSEAIFGRPLFLITQ